MINAFSLHFHACECQSISFQFFIGSLAAKHLSVNIISTPMLTLVLTVELFFITFCPRVAYQITFG